MSVFFYIRSLIFALLSQLGLPPVITNTLANVSLVAIAAGVAIALPPAASISRARACNGSSRLPESASCAPRSANRRATSEPIEPDAGAYVDQEVALGHWLRRRERRRDFAAADAVGKVADTSEQAVGAAPHGIVRGLVPRSCAVLEWCRVVRVSLCFADGVDGYI